MEKRVYKYFLLGLIFFALLGEGVSIAQTKINGEVLDNLGKPLSHASVLLLSPVDSTLILGAVSEESGRFQFDKVQQDGYLLSVSLVGHKKHIEKILVTRDSNVMLHPITLYELVDELDEVIVAAQKPLYEKQIDRMIINVQESITAAGNSVLEVLQKSPGVLINRQNNSILLNGKSGVSVMINNKLSRLPMDAVVQMLNGLSAANVEKIELISNPPSKYDAEGTGGIIHIVMLENADFGTNGNVGLTAGMNGGETLGTNFNINHRSNKMSYFTDYSILYDHNKEKAKNGLEFLQPDFTSEFRSKMNRSPFTTVQNFRAGVELNIGEKTVIGSMITLYQRHFKMKAISAIANKISLDSSRNASINVRELNRWQSFTANINLTHSLDAKNTLRLDLDYLHYHNKNPSSYQNNFYYPERNLSRYQHIEIEKETPIYFKVFKLDYTYRPFPSFVLEAGVKGTVSDFVNDVEVNETEKGIREKDPELTVRANLDEEISAAYLSTEWSINSSNQLNAGLRYEHTQTYISTQEIRGVVDRDFGNLFPSLFYKKTFNDQLGIYLGYSRRITRPTFNDMAPFVFILDPNTFFSGNPALKPAIVDGVKLDVNIKRALVSLDYSYSKNEIANFQPEIDPHTKRQIFRSQNLDFLKLYSVTLSVPWILTDWWEIQWNSSGFFRKFKTQHLQENTTRDLYNFNLNLTNNILLPKDFMLEVTGFYDSKMMMGIWEFRPIGSLNIGIQKTLKENRGTLRLAIDDMLYTNVWKMNSQISPEVVSHFEVDFHNQSIRLTYNRTFGNKKLKDVSIKSGSEEERKRVQ